MIEWAKLQGVYEAARAADVVFTLNFVDIDNEWYFTVESVEAGENWIGRPTDFDTAIASVVSWLHRIALTKS